MPEHRTPINTSTYAFHDLIYVPPNAWTIKDYTVHDASSATVSYNDTGAHALAGIVENATTPIGLSITGTKSNAGIYDTETSLYGIVLLGTYTNAPIYIGGIPLIADFLANGAVATVLGSVGATGAHTTVQEWLQVKNAAGVVRYVPAF